MKPIGGFFELEQGTKDELYHLEALPLTSGRACFNYILQQFNPAHVHVPFFCCDSLLVPLTENNIQYTFYHIDEELNPINLDSVGNNELIVYINYYGLKNNTVQTLIKKFRDQLVIDNTHAFFERNQLKNWSFNSTRKFFGVPDGGYLYGPKLESANLERNDDLIIDHLVLRLEGKQEESYQHYLNNEDMIKHEILGMSEYSEKLLGKVDYEAIKHIRQSNFEHHEKRLSSYNKLNITGKSDGVPCYYPFLIDAPIDRNILFEQQIFIPCLWPDVINREIEEFEFEKSLARNILPLPIDHRYTIADCDTVVDSILELIN
ncbi:hypothetical protein JYU23_01375 [bacterium AH-315-C07]|nr:hypothetical protein [bacterium AH-315-C07]